MPLSKAKALLVERLRKPRTRPREGQFIVEGIRGCREVLTGALTPAPRFALTSPRLSETLAGRLLMDELVSSHVPLDEVSEEELADLSDTQQSQGVLLVVAEPPNPLLALGEQMAPKLLILDGIQDPGNVGSLIRAAWAFGLHGALALDGTVDPFNPKVVRASAGALAHLPVARLSWEDAEPWLGEREIPLLVADSSGEDVRALRAPSTWALCVGNEGAGVRARVRDRADRLLAIPMRSGADSLNAGLAGAILLFALTPSFGSSREM